MFQTEISTSAAFIAPAVRKGKLALLLLLTGCGVSLTAPCNQAACNNTPSNPKTTLTCNQTILSATSDLNNTSLSPLDANGNPVPSQGVVNGSIAAMIQACNLDAWDGTNPQNWQTNKSGLTFFKPKGGTASFVDTTTTSYVEIHGNPSIRFDNMDLAVNNGVVAVNSSAADEKGDNGQNGAPLDAPLQPTAAEMTKDAAFAATNGDVWNFTGDFTANQLKYDRVLANAFGQGYAQSLGGYNTTAMALQVESTIKAATGVDVAATSFISYAQYNLGPSATPDGIFITHNNTFYSDINPTDGNSYPIQNSGDFSIFWKSGTTYKHIDFRMDGLGRVHDMKGGQFVWTTPASAETPLTGQDLANAQAIAAGFGVTFSGLTFTKPAVVMATGEIQAVSATVTAKIDQIQTESAATDNAIKELNQFDGNTGTTGIVNDTAKSAAAPTEAAPGPISMFVTPRFTLKGASSEVSRIMMIDSNRISGSEMTLSSDGGSVVRLFGTAFEEGKKFNKLNDAINAANKSGGVPKAGFSTAPRFDFAT